MDDGSNRRPDWLPSWLPEGNTVKYVSGGLQLIILLLAAAFLASHLFKGKIKVAAATAAGAS
jgi:hypothetical protein